MIQIRDEMVDSIGIAGPSDSQVWSTQPQANRGLKMAGTCPSPLSR